MSKIFIKIKIDSTETGTSSEDTAFLEFTDDNTFRDVKEHLEGHINIAADQQVIKTVIRTFHDNEKLSAFCDIDRKEGSALQLYDTDSNFICFLQLFNEDEAAVQRQYEQQSKQCSFFKSLSSTSITTLVADSDSDSDMTESSGSTKSSKRCLESDNEDATDSNVGKKRKKRFEPLFTKYTSQYLDGLPINPDAMISSSTSTTEREKSPEKTENQLHETATIDAIITKETVTPMGSLIDPVPSQNVHSSTLSESRQYPCAHIIPENRKFIAIAKMLSHEDVHKKKYQIFLEDCFIKFERTESVASLRFDDEMPITLDSHGTIWIACKDECTLSWILENIKCLANISCSVEKFFNKNRFKAYTLVIPGFQDITSRNLKDIFSFLEMQNTGLNTSEWIVDKRRHIAEENDEFIKRKISHLCPNEILYLSINNESEEFMKRNNYQLKFCFWKLSMYLDDNE